MSPGTEAEVAEAVRDATGPLSVQGGGTRGLASEGQGLSVAGLSGITLYEPGALTLVAKAGTPVAEIESTLDAENQRLAFEPMDHRKLLNTQGTPTIGGVFAANVSGPRRPSVGAARDFLLGVRFVDGHGTLIRNGGRVMKNVTGYDLVKLLAGSHGTLGVLTEVAFKVLPRPETEATLVLNGLDAAAALTSMNAALGSPFEVSGAAYLPDRAETLLRLEGFEASVRYRIERLKDLLSVPESDVLAAEASAARWADLRDVQPFHAATGDVWRVACKASEAAALVARSGSEAAYYDWAGGRIWLRTAAGHDLRAALGAFDGHATLVRATPDTRARLGTFHPEAPGVARLTAGLRARFDPKGLFNVGLMEAS